MEDPVEYSLNLVEDAEIYIGIFALRYGYVPEDPDRNPDGLSITELEYRHAFERGIPVLIFIMDEEHPVKAGSSKPTRRTWSSSTGSRTNCGASTWSASSNRRRI